MALSARACAWCVATSPVLLPGSGMRIDRGPQKARAEAFWEGLAERLEAIAEGLEYQGL